MINGSKAIICPKSLTDAVDDYIWQTDSELARLTATQILTTSFAEYLLGYSKQLRHQPTKCQFSIKSRHGKHIGNCAYYGVNGAKGEAEIGIIIGDRRYWDKGYGTDAVSSLVDYIFNKLNLNRIHLKTLDSNKRAQRCFEKCGFRVYGNKTNGGNSFVLMELRRDRWQKPMKAGSYINPWMAS